MVPRAGCSGVSLEQGAAVCPGGLESRSLTADKAPPRAGAELHPQASTRGPHCGRAGVWVSRSRVLQVGGQVLNDSFPG